MDLLDSPLSPVVAGWLAKVKLGLDLKNKRFAQDAREGMKFFSGPYDFLYGDDRHKDKHFKQREDSGEDDNEIPPPKFQVTANKCAELVQLFGPVLYHRNPVRQVTPREYPLPDAETAAAFGGDPNAQMYLMQLNQMGVVARSQDATRARLISHYLNYTPDALDLKSESRRAIDEALIKGMGLLWVERYVDPVGNEFVGSFFDSVDNLVIDPDAKSLAAAKWVARRRCEPVWQVERKFGLAAGSLRGNAESSDTLAAAAAHPDFAYRRLQGETNDLLTYWEVWSKNGLGGRLTGVPEYLRTPLEEYGDFCYLAVADGLPHPLNVPDQLWTLPDRQGVDEVRRRVQWPTPFWMDDSWPFAEIVFHEIPNDPWPMSHLAPGMGELKFLNWAYSYIAGKIRISCRDFLAIKEEATKELEEAVLHGADYELIKVKGSMGQSVGDLVQFLQHPTMNRDIWSVIEAIAVQFDRRVGLTELMYGESARQLRSAAEADLKAGQLNVRPDDMANKVEDAMSKAARLEAIALRWHMTQGAKVAPVMGPVGAALWDQFVVPTNPSQLLHSLEYRIEAGSTRKPNRERDAANANTAVQTFLPVAQQLLGAGLVAPFNTLVEVFGRANDMKVDGLMVPAPQQPPAAPPGQPPPGGPGGQPQP